MLRSLLLIVLSTPLGLTAMGAEITFRESATPTRGGLVRLGDVAEVRGFDAGRLVELPLMPKPAPGDGQLLSAQAVREMLAAQGEPPASHRFGGAYFVRVTTPRDTGSIKSPAERGWREATPTRTRTTTQRSNAFRVRTGESATPTKPRRVAPRLISRRDVKTVEGLITQAVQEAIDKLATNDPEADRLAVRGVQVSDAAVRELLKVTDQPLEVRFAKSEPLTAGSTSVQVGPASRDAGEAHRVVLDLISLPMRIVAASPMQRDAMIVASMVRIEPIPLEEIDRPQSLGYTRLDQVVGRESTRMIRPGDVLSDANTAPPLLVQRGEEVTVSSGGGGISVRVRAVAKQEGRQGELVTVETLDTAEKFMARVVGARRLAVLSAGPSIATAARKGGLR